LRVPRIALRAEELVRTLAQRQRCAPLNEFIRGTYCEDNATCQEAEHLPCPNVPASKKDFPRRQRWNKALGKVTNLVVWIPMQTECLGELETQWNPGIRVRTSNKQNDRMKEGADVEQVGQWEARVGCNEQWCYDEDWEDFHDPSGTVIGVPTGPNQEADQNDKGDEKNLGAMHRL
jgi:hypothetical protein